MDKDLDKGKVFGNHRLLSRKEAAEFLGVKEDTLALWQSAQRYNLPIVKVGRLAKYRFEDLLEFVERRTVNKPSGGYKEQMGTKISTGRPWPILKR
jgi:hypothetical protein